MSYEKDGLQKYKNLKNSGCSEKEIFIEAKKEGMENYKAIQMLTILFDMSVDAARKISHEVYYENKE